jgi:protoporphyrinogen oxidase
MKSESKIFDVFYGFASASYWHYLNNSNYIFENCFTTCTTMEQKQNIIIIGGGPCGLGAAWRLEEIRRQSINANNKHGSYGPFNDWTLVDQSSSSGGLAASIIDENGFTWDKGGHVIFSHYAYFSRLLDSLIPDKQWNTLEREAWVWMRNRFVPYPFQQNIHRLPEQDIVSIMDGLLENERKKSGFNKPNNFAEWLEQSFGKGLCDVFMTPYNQKVWAYNPEQMNVEWMGERVATVDTSKVLKNLSNFK